MLVLRLHLKNLISLSSLVALISMCQLGLTLRSVLAYLYSSVDGLVAGEIFNNWPVVLRGDFGPVAAALLERLQHFADTVAPVQDWLHTN